MGLKYEQGGYLHFSNSNPPPGSDLPHRSNAHGDINLNGMFLHLLFSAMFLTWRGSLWNVCQLLPDKWTGLGLMGSSHVAGNCREMPGPHMTPGCQANVP